MRKLLAALFVAGIPLVVSAALGTAAHASAKPVDKIAAKPAAKAAKGGGGGGDLASGKKVYEASCAMCHGSMATKKPTLPNAADFFKGQFKYTKGDPKELDKMIKLGGTGYGKGASPQMPPQSQLSDKDRKDVIAFIKAMKK